MIVQWSLVVASTFSSLFIYALDSTIVADLVPVWDALRGISSRSC